MQILWTSVRQRIFEKKTEKSVIDYIIICEELLKYLIEISIDEERIHALSRYMKKKTGNKIIMSDHNVLTSRFSITFKRKPKFIRKEFFQFKSEEGKKKFLEETSSTSKFSSCFKSKKNFGKNANSFYKTLNRTFYRCFKKVRIRSGNDRLHGENNIQLKMKQKSNLKLFIKNNKCKIAEIIATNKLSEIEDEIVEETASKNAEIVREHLESLETVDCNFSRLGMWRLKQKLCPITEDPPMAKHDETGNIITAQEPLKQLYIETYKNRLRNRKMKDEYKDIFMLKSELCLSRMEHLKHVKSPPWNIKQLDQVLKSLKNNKTRDPAGMVNEVFKAGCIGSNLKEALLTLMNGIKENIFIPEFMTLSNITTIFKKGSRLDMNNDRGIFILTVAKKILDKLIYVDNYHEVDKNMSDSNVGGRRKRNIKDHLLIIHGIINSVIRGNEDCIDIQIYDIEKCFDALWLEDCINDIIDNLPAENQNDKIALLYESNRKNLVAVKTAVGLTERVDMPSIVQQGGTWGPLMCSSSMDTIGKKCRDRDEHCYLYKNTAKILPLAFVDDLNGISKCGFDSISLNTFLTTQIELKKLRFHVADKKGKSNGVLMHVFRGHFELRRKKFQEYQEQDFQGNWYYQPDY